MLSVPVFGQTRPLQIDDLRVRVKALESLHGIGMPTPTPTPTPTPVNVSGLLKRYAGNPLIPMGSAESIDSIKTGPRVVLKENGIYRMWYEAVPGGGGESIDGWLRCIL